MKKILFGAGLAVTVFVSNMLLVWSGISISGLADFTQLEQELFKLISLPFLAFSALLALRFIIACCAKNSLGDDAPLVIGVGGLVGYIAAVGLLVGWSEFWVLDFFTLIALVVIASRADSKNFEFEKIKGILGTGMLLLGIGLFISTAITIMPIQDELNSKFEDKIFATAFEGTDLAEQAVQSQIEMNRQFFAQMKRLPSYNSLKESEDLKAKSFGLEMQALENALNSPETRTAIKTEIEKRLEGQSGQLDAIKEKIPFFNLFQEYYWAFTSLVFMQFFMLYLILIKWIALAFSWYFYNL